MKWFSAALPLAFACALCAGLGAAAGLPLETLPANAKWVLHLDVKALRDAPMGREILAALAGSPQEAGLKAFEETTGVDVRRDVSAITVCGAGGEEQGGVVYLSGNWNLQKLSAILAGNDRFVSLTYRNHALLSWNEAGTSKGSARQNACLVSTNLVLLGNREAALKQALDALDGRTAALSTVPRFRRLAPLDADAFLRLIATDLKDIVADNPQAAALPSADSLRLALSSEGRVARLKAVLKAATPEAAQQLQQALVGLQAVLMLQGLKNPDLGQLAQSARIAINGPDVSVQLTAPLETVTRLLFSQKAGTSRHAPPPTPYPPAN